MKVDAISVLGAKAIVDLGRRGVAKLAGCNRKWQYVLEVNILVFDRKDKQYKSVIIAI